MNTMATKIATAVCAGLAIFLVLVDANAVVTAFTTAPASTSSVQQKSASSSPSATIAPTTSSSNSTTPSGSLTSSESTSDTTSNWSGYAAFGGTFTRVSGSWTVPSAAGTGDTSADATWIGIGGVSSDDLIQVGTQNIISSNNGATSSAFYELLPDASEPLGSLSVNAGDSVTASITQAGPDLWAIRFSDITTGQGYATTVSYDSSNSSAEWIEEDPSDGPTEIPLDSFGTVPFSAVTATENGATVNLVTSKAQLVTMVNSEGQPLATVSALGGDGASFSVTRTNATSASPIPQFNRDPGGWVRRGSRIEGEDGGYSTSSGGSPYSAYPGYSAPSW
jgi:hypothetical protein